LVQNIFVLLSENYLSKGIMLVLTKKLAGTRLKTENIGVLPSILCFIVIV